MTALFKVAGGKSESDVRVFAMDILLTGLNTITERWGKEIDNGYHMIIADHTDQDLVLSGKVASVLNPGAEGPLKYRSSC